MQGKLTTHQKVWLAGSHIVILAAVTAMAIYGANLSTNGTVRVILYGMQLLAIVLSYFAFSYVRECLLIRNRS